MSQYIDWSALGQVVAFGLLVGAGLPALFALGVRALEGPGSRPAETASHLPWAMAASMASRVRKPPTQMTGIFSFALNCGV